MIGGSPLCAMFTFIFCAGRKSFHAHCKVHMVNSKSQCLCWVDCQESPLLDALFCQCGNLGSLPGLFQVRCRHALLACWVSVGSLRTTKYLWNNSYRAVFLDGLLPELVGLGWELSSLELFSYLRLVLIFSSSLIVVLFLSSGFCE